VSEKTSISWVRIQLTLGTKSSVAQEIHVVLSDITEKKMEETEKEQALNQLIQSEARYRAIIEEQSELVCRYLPDGRVSFVNESYLRYFGKSLSDIINKNFIPHIPPDDLITVNAHLSKITATEPLTHFEHRVIMPNGKVRWQYWTHRGIYSEGKLVEFQAVGRDITANRESEIELERLLTDLGRKNQELERFNYTISHDLKSPLLTVQMFAQEIEESLAVHNYEDVKDFSKRIQVATKSMSLMVQDLLKLARLGQKSIHYTPISLDAVLTEVTIALSGSMNPLHATIVIVNKLPTILGCSSRLRELFQNLIENALKFRMQSNDLKVEIGCEDCCTHWNVFVRDNGIGISQANQSVIFGLFQKLNPKSEGSGIGLSIVNRIAEMHNAEVTVQSKGEGLGSTFWIRFPKVN
jgi:PAS domain S-box-containing protein